MKVWPFYIVAFCFFTGIEVFLFGKSEDPEKLLLGKWREVAWQYESSEVSDDVSERVGKTLVIHKAEYWEFLPNRTLVVSGKEGKGTAQWRLAGRANVLQLQHGRAVAEHYSVGELTHDTLVLNFETDIQAKGVAKLVFRRAGVL